MCAHTENPNFTAQLVNTVLYYLSAALRHGLTIERSVLAAREKPIVFCGKITTKPHNIW